MNIGELISKRRSELGLTLEEVGKAVGVSKSTVKKWEDGFISNMKRDKIAELAKILRLNPVSLITGDELIESNIETLPNNKVTESDIKFALFGDTNVDDEVLEDVMRYARIARQMREDKQNKDWYKQGGMP